MAVVMGFNLVVALTERGGLLIFGETYESFIHENDDNDDDQQLYFEPVLLGGVAQGAALEEAAPAAEHPFGGEAVLMLGGGDQHVCCLTDSGAVWVCGSNEEGQLGLGDEARRALPVRWADSVCGQSPVVMVACGGDTTVVLTAAKQVWACGCGFSGQNSSPTWGNLSVPTRVPSLDNIVMVSAQDALAVAVDEDRLVWTWGSGNMPPDMYTPKKLEAAEFGGRAVVFVASGNLECAAVTDKGVLWVWGMKHTAPDHPTISMCPCGWAPRSWPPGGARGCAW